MLNGTQYIYITNNSSDVMAIADISGNILATYSYNEWGVPTISATGEQNTALANLNPLRYRGYYYDAETGYYYLQSRYYDPEICRFINADLPEYAKEQKNEAAGINVYVYCCNDAVNSSDTSGKKKSNRTYVIYYNGTGNLSKFALNAYYRFKNPKYIAVKTVNDFVKAWNGMSYILDVYLYLHGGPGKLYFQGESMELSKFGRLYYKNVSAHIYLLSCHGAKKNDDGNNVAWGLAGRTNTKVHACLGGVSYLKLLGGKYIARSAFKDNKYGSWSMYYYKNGKRNSMFSSLMGL